MIQHPERVLKGKRGKSLISHSRAEGMLRAWVPLLDLLVPAQPHDPVRGVGLPGAGDPPADASAISAYYLSFYE